MQQNPAIRRAPAPRVGWLKRLLSDVLFIVARDRKWWLVPLLIVLFLLASLFFLAAGAGPLAPFIYPLL